MICSVTITEIDLGEKASSKFNHAQRDTKKLLITKNTN